MVSFTVTVSNSGDATGDNIVVNDILPQYFTLVGSPSVSLGSVSIDGTGISWSGSDFDLLS